MKQTLLFYRAFIADVMYKTQYKRHNKTGLKINFKKFQKNEKMLDISDLSVIISNVDAELCKGSTADSDSVCLGSNPSSAATSLEFIFGAYIFFEV